VKLHLLLITVLFISSATTQIDAVPERLGSQAADIIVRGVAFGSSATVAVVAFGIGFWGLSFALAPARGSSNSMLGLGELSQICGPVISVPAMLVGSLATYSALLSVGIQNKPATQVSAAIFGVSMLLSSLSHWISLKNGSHSQGSFCIGMGVFTGISGLASLALCLRK